MYWNKSNFSAIVLFCAIYHKKWGKCSAFVEWKKYFLFDFSISTRLKWFFFGTASLWIPNNTVCVIVKCFFSIIIIPLIQFPSLARPINFQWHLSKWNKWNDCFLSFVQCVRHYVTYVGSLPYLEPIIWWVGRQPTSAEIRVLKSIGGEKHGWCLYSIWQKWTV